ncbi:MAG: hybrid sensor histidine kinase/response regulator [Sedimentisphaerales bacterium]|nr:hybrid sensor histidine kinase/response regulator [Sedimentisphaerales bacterium]
MTTLNLLGVDDEKGMRLGIKRALEVYTFDITEINETVNFNIVLAETGEEAVDMIRTRTPDVLLLDYKLPGITGLDVLNQTAEFSEKMLTIMITAYASIETAITATKHGAYDFLPKPFTPEDLRHSVRKAAARIIIARRASELEEANKRVRFDFIRVLGHELKAPLSSVTSYLHIMKDHISGSDIKSYDDMIHRCLVRLGQMNKLILDLLDMTRIESGQKNRTLVSVDLNAVVGQAVELIRTDAADRRISVHTDVPENSIMAGDEAEINMILNNLVSNAVKYNRDGGSVVISLSRDDEVVTLKVQDTGIGMTQEEADRLFGEFVRIHNARTKNILGSGLGLSIVKKLAELYGGTVSVQSEPNEGSTFTVLLKDSELPSETVKQESVKNDG